MAEKDGAAGIDDKNSRQLADVALGQAEQVTLGHGRHPLEGNDRREKCPGLHAFEFERPVKSALRIGDDWKGNFVLLCKSRRLRRRSHPYQHHLPAALVKALFFPAQLRHLLPAEGSAEVAQKHQNQRFGLPEFAESLLRTVG